MFHRLHIVGGVVVAGALAVASFVALTPSHHTAARAANTTPTTVAARPWTPPNGPARPFID